MGVKIAIISDLHFGFARGTERSEDCWQAAEEAFEKARGCDLIILPGDIFDEKIPRPDEWAKALRLFSRVKIPMVAIHGTHERRGRGLINSVEALEYASLLDHVHCTSETYEIKGKKINVYGMSGVPEAYSKEVLDQWNPSPGEGFNIFMLHQSIHPYIYNPIEPPSLKLEDLPKGFDLYISGHIHWREETEVMGKPFIIPGSLVTTQVNKTETKYPKGFYIAEISGDSGKELKLDFVELDTPRKVFYKDFKINNEKISDIMEKIEKYMDGIKEDKKPLVRIRVTGKIGKGESLDFSRIKEKYRNKMILSLSSRVSEEELEGSMKFLEEIRESRISVEEMGMKILTENLMEMGVRRSYEELFDLLVEGNVDAAMVSVLSATEEEQEVTEEKDNGEKKDNGMENSEEVKELDKEEFENFLKEDKFNKTRSPKNLLGWSSKGKVNE